jgi:5-methyltetrahydrofolate--homocysteine methyltransferase
MSFDPARDGFRTSSGLAVTEAAKAMTNAGAHAVGANCGTVTPDQMAEVVGLFRKAVTCPIIAQANAGLPELRGDQAVFRLSPEAFASGMVRTARAGAQLLGGCCGTTPAHIRALCKALRE